MKLLQLAYRNILHNPLNLLLSIILFGLGIGLINFLTLANTQLKEKFDANLAEIDMVIGAKGSPLQMILSSMYHIDSPTGNITVGEAKAFLNPKHPIIKSSVPLSLGDSYKSYRIVGTTDSILSYYHAKIESGKLWGKDYEVVIGRLVADETGLKIGDRFKSSHGFNDDADLAHDHAAFVVVGILEGSGSVIDQLILTNLSTVWNVHDHQETEEGHQEIEVSDNDDAHRHDHEDHSHDDHDHGSDDHNAHNHDSDDHDAHNHEHSIVDAPFAMTNADLLNYPEKEITSILVKFKSRTNFQALNMPNTIKENTDMMAASPAIEINRMYQMIGSGRQLIEWLAVLIAIISAISIFIVLYKSMRERKYELALMRVVGGSRASLFQLIIMEGVILTLVGFLVGFILSHVGMELMSVALKDSYRYSFTGWKFMADEGKLLLVSLLIGVIAAFIPAYQASRADIHKTLSEKE